MDFAIQRMNMVESQVRPSDVTDRRIIRAMRELPREQFVPEPMRTFAYMDDSVPITRRDSAGPRRSLLAARVFAKLVQAAEIEPTDAVLDVGAGTGYSSAVLSRLAGSVIALECDGELAAAAKDLLVSVDCTNVRVVEGDLTQGWAIEGPYDAIVMAGAVEVAPTALFDQLKDGGRLVAIFGRGSSGKTTVWRREGRSFGSAVVFDAGGDVLPGFEKPRAFAF